VGVLVGVGDTIKGVLVKVYIGVAVGVLVSEGVNAVADAVGSNGVSVGNGVRVSVAVRVSVTVGVVGCLSSPRLVLWTTK